MTRPIGILHLTTFLQGGAGRAIADLACAQHRAGHMVSVSASESAVGEFGNYDEHVARIREAGVPLHLCDSLFRRDRASHARVLAMLHQRVDVPSLDVIHAHAGVPARIGCAVSRMAPEPIPVIQTQHGWGSSKTPAQEREDVDILCRVARVVTTSTATRAALVSRQVPAAAIEVIPCGLSAETAPIPDVARQTIEPLRQRGATIVACIGSMTPNKNQRLLVEALRHVTDRQVVVVFIGEGQEALADVIRETNMGDRIVTCGYQPAAAAWLPLCDVLVLPSRTEGQGLCVLEGFRSRIPVVASRIPALEELVEDQQTGLMFECDNPTALAKSIDSALIMPAAERRHMLSRASALFRERFTVDAMIARHEDLYRNVIRTSLTGSEPLRSPS